MATPMTRVFVKCSNCSVSFDLEFEKGLTTDDGFDRYSISTKFIPETGAVFTFKTQHGYRPKVSVYDDPIYDGGSHKISNYGTLISDDAGSVANIPKEEGSFLIVAEAVSDSGINFTYDKIPKFREQETPHVYFDTMKGGSTRTETHTYTYEDASVTGTITRPSPITGDAIVETFYKVHDFMTPEELIGQILGNTIPKEAAITNEDIDDLSRNILFRNYPGTIKFIVNLGKRGGRLISLDSAYTYDDNAGNSVSFPEPGVYLSDNSILTIAKEVQTSPSPFSKNVTVKAHTEYTAHINGRIGEGGDVDGNAYAIIVDANDEVLEGEYDKAKKYFLAEKTVVIVFHSGKEGKVVESAAVVEIEEPYEYPNGTIHEGALITHHVSEPGSDHYYAFTSNNTVYRQETK